MKLWLYPKGGVNLLNKKRIFEERDFYRERIRRTERRLSMLPTGRLQICKNGKYMSWRLYNPATGESRCIHKCDEAAAADLAYRMHLEKLIEDDTRELRAIERYLEDCVDEEHGKVHCSCEEEFERLLRLRLPVQGDPDSVQLSEMYPRSTYNLAKQKYTTNCGFKVRSKSEAIIAELLTKNGLEIVYEPVLSINGRDYIPDFIIRNPRTGKIYIWEHFGMMDNPDYAFKSIQKLQCGCLYALVCNIGY